MVAPSEARAKVIAECAQRQLKRSEACEGWFELKISTGNTETNNHLLHGWGANFFILLAYLLNNGVLGMKLKVNLPIENPLQEVCIPVRQDQTSLVDIGFFSRHFADFGWSHCVPRLFF